MTILYIVLAIVVLGFIVMMHELGHFAVGRLSGIDVKEFSVGFGPKLFAWQGKRTQYSVRLIPLGGYCAFVGEDETNGDPGAFNNQRAWKRFLTVLAGPISNFILALVCAFLFYAIFGMTEITPVPSVYSAEEGMPAQEAGLMVGDVILSVNGTEISYDPEGVKLLQKTVAEAGEADPASPVELLVRRGEEELSLSCRLQLTDGRYLMGITMGYTEETVRLSLWQSAKTAVFYIRQTMGAMVQMLMKLFTTGEGIGDTAGPVYIVDTVAQGIRSGFDQVLYLIVIISMNLGIMNLLPLPALDGGRLVFLLIEMIFRKPVKREVEGVIHAVGLVLLFALILFVSGRDILRLFGKL